MIDRSAPGVSAETTSLPHARLLATSAVAILLQFIVQFLIGWWLSRAYTPTPDGAHSSAAALHAGGVDRFLQAVHYWGSAVLILHSLLHMVAMAWFGWYRSPNGLRFVAATLIFLCSLGFQLSGNLLPFDRHGVQTAAIEASIAARAPVMGGQVSRIMLGGSEVGAGTLSTWFAAHRLFLPLLAASAIGLAIYAQSKRKDAVRHSRLGAIAPLAIVLVLAAAVPSPFGSAASPADFDTFHARTSWYVWPLHGMLRLFDSLGSGLGWIGAMLIPGLAVAFLLTLPLTKAKVPVVRGVLIGLAALMLGSGLLFGGAPADIVGTRDPASVETKPSTQVASAIDRALADRGRVAFNGMSCAGCHGKDGKEAGGGPSLANTWKQHLDADYYIRYIQKPTAVQPDSTMPAFPKIPADDLKAIAEYLRGPH